MKWHEQHEAFKRLLIQQGIHSLEQVNQALPLGYSVPKARLNRWLDNALTVPFDFSAQRRYINRFKIGADPEFVFHKDGERMDARALGLHQGLAFGMDNNGRLVEIRPYPSRSAVAVVASMLLALRWLSILQPPTLTYNWTAGAFQIGDCLGGHVHFGRKRPNRSEEVKALDLIDDELIVLKSYPQAEVIRRRQGDGRNHPYGLPGDIRLQAHGYEYRSFPSWLDSPELAFLTLTLSKLAVHNPILTQGYVPLDLPRHFQRIKNLLSYYKDTDDDARLALALITRKLPVHVGGDFKARWGIAAVENKLEKVQFVPDCFKPTANDITEMFDYLQGKRTLAPRVPEITWGPLNPPDSYYMLLSSTSTYGAKGLGELLWDICSHKNCTYQFQNLRDGRWFFSIPDKLANQLPGGWHRMCGGKVKIHYDGATCIYSTEESRTPLHFHEARRILLETVLPFWKIGEVKPDSYQQWKVGLRQKERQRFLGQILTGDLSLLPFKDIR